MSEHREISELEETFPKGVPFHDSSIEGVHMSSIGGGAQLDLELIWYFDNVGHIGRSTFRTAALATLKFPGLIELIGNLSENSINGFELAGEGILSATFFSMVDFWRAKFQGGPVQCKMIKKASTSASAQEVPQPAGFTVEVARTSFESAVTLANSTLVRKVFPEFGAELLQNHIGGRFTLSSIIEGSCRTIYIEFKNEITFDCRIVSETKSKEDENGMRHYTSIDCKKVRRLSIPGVIHRVGKLQVTQLEGGILVIGRQSVNNSVQFILECERTSVHEEFHKDWYDEAIKFYKLHGIME